MLGIAYVLSIAVNSMVAILNLHYRTGSTDRKERVIEIPRICNLSPPLLSESQITSREITIRELWILTNL